MFFIGSLLLPGPNKSQKKKYSSLGGSVTSQQNFMSIWTSVPAFLPLLFQILNRRVIFPWGTENNTFVVPGWQPDIWTPCSCWLVNISVFHRLASGRDPSAASPEKWNIKFFRLFIPPRGTNFQVPHPRPQQPRSGPGSPASLEGGRAKVTRTKVPRPAPAVGSDPGKGLQDSGPDLGNQRENSLFSFLKSVFLA